jgi:hypothetical protein
MSAGKNGASGTAFSGVALAAVFVETATPVSRVAGAGCSAIAYASKPPASGCRLPIAFSRLRLADSVTRSMSSMSSGGKHLVSFHSSMISSAVSFVTP